MYDENATMKMLGQQNALTILDNPEMEKQFREAFETIKKHYPIMDMFATMDLFMLGYIWGKRAERKRKKISLEAVTLNKRKLNKIIKNEDARLTPEIVTDMVAEIITYGADTKQATPLEKLAFIAKQTYLYGFYVSLNFFNNFLKKMNNDSEPL